MGEDLLSRLLHLTQPEFDTLHGSRLKIFLLIDVLYLLRHVLHPLIRTFDPLICRLQENDLLLPEIPFDTFLLKIVQFLHIILLEEKLQTVISRLLETLRFPYQIFQQRIEMAECNQWRWEHRFLLVFHYDSETLEHPYLRCEERKLIEGGVLEH